jgi:hypothetical protein
MKFITLLALIATAVSVQAQEANANQLSANFQANELSAHRMLKADQREVVDMEDLETDYLVLWVNRFYWASKQQLF